MPLKKYDKYFGGKGGAKKAHAAMTEEYGPEKGEQVFYATKNKRKSMHGGSTAISPDSMKGRALQGRKTNLAHKMEFACGTQDGRKNG